MQDVCYSVKNLSFSRLRTDRAIEHQCLFVLWLRNIDCGQRHQGDLEDIDGVVAAVHDDRASAAAVTIALRVERA